MPVPSTPPLALWRRGLLLDTVRGVTEFARVHHYFADLPNGIDSYRFCRVKASLLRQCLEAQRPSSVEGLPGQLVELITAPPPASSWITEVEYCATNLAIADANGWSSEEFSAFWYEVMDALVRNRVYRFIFGFMTAAQAVRSASLRWSTFHKGTSLSVVSREEDAGNLMVEIRLAFPPGLLPPILTEAYCQVFRRFVELSRQPMSTVRLLKLDSMTALYGLELKAEDRAPLEDQA